MRRATHLSRTKRFSNQLTTELGFTFALDTCVIDDTSDAMQALRQYYEDDFIRLVRSDVVDTELLKGDNPRQQELLSMSQPFPENLGPLVLGNSRIGHSVLGCSPDNEILEKVAHIRKQKKFGELTQNDKRDVMQVAWARRYGCFALITRDGLRADGSIKPSSLLGISDELSKEFDGFKTLTPDHALVIVDRFHRRYVFRTQSADSRNDME